MVAITLELLCYGQAHFYERLRTSSVDRHSFQISLYKHSVALFYVKNKQDILEIKSCAILLDAGLQDP
jgi:hypothetical protein